MALRPVRLEPQFVPRIWGARTLAPLFPAKQSLREPIGEVWLTGDDCRFADGPFAGERVRDAWPRMDDNWAGKRARHDQPFPVLVKFLFPNDKLSVQVHPDDEYASRHEAAAGGIGKTEMWYVVSARAGAEVRAGLKPGVTKGSFRRAIADDTAEEMLERIPVGAGDTIFVPAGTVHSIGAGMVLCEIQQNSDITYRVFDYRRLDAHGKPRELHIEKALDVMRFGKQHAGKITDSDRGGEIQRTATLVECPHFTVVEQAFQKATCITGGERLEVLVAIEGSGAVHSDRGSWSAEYSRAQTWLIPSALREITLTPKEPTRILRVTAPSL